MDRTAPPSGNGQHLGEAARLRGAAKQLGVTTLRDGSWFQRMVTKHVKQHLTTVDPARWDRLYPGLDAEERSDREIRRVARKVAAAGVLASVGASAGEILSLVTEGLGAPIGVPAAVISMALEGAYTSLLQVDLACDIAAIYGVPFDADDFGEVATLFGLALEVDVKRQRLHEDDAETSGGGGLTSRLVELQDGEVAKRIGKKLLEEAVIRNAIPFVGIAISGRWNYAITRRLGRTVKKYVRYRRALVHQCARLRLEHVADPTLLVEGAWLLATVDGEAGHEEVMALALMLEQLSRGSQVPLPLDAALGEDEERWFERLGAMPPPMIEPLLAVLYLIAATDRELQAAEKRFLRRVGKVLRREIDFSRLESIRRHLADGIDLPEGAVVEG